jgi:hypothetical protein
MYGSPTPQRDFRQAEQASRDHEARVQSIAARRAQLGMGRPALRDRARAWFRWLPWRKGSER